MDKLQILEEFLAALEQLQEYSENEYVCVYSNRIGFAIRYNIEDKILELMNEIKQCKETNSPRVIERKDPKDMPEKMLNRFKEFLDYFHVDYSKEVITLTSGCTSVVMNAESQWKDFLGYSIASVAEAVAVKLGKKIVWKDDFDDEDYINS